MRGQSINPIRSIAAVLLAGMAVAGCPFGEGQRKAPVVATALPATPVESTRTESAALSDTLYLPRWRVGSSWLYSDGYGLTISKVDGDVTVFTRTDDPAQWFSRRGLLREQAQSETTFRNVVYRTISPDAGMALKLNQPLVFTREFLADGDLRVHVTSWTLEGMETITVPAGEFECWVVVMRSRSLTSNWDGFERWWYSPKARNYVRIEYQYGARPESSRVLMSFSLGPENGG